MFEGQIFDAYEIASRLVKSAKQRMSGEYDVHHKRRNEETDAEAEREIANYIESKDRPSLLFDIQEKIRSGAGEGYVHWMKIFNLKQAAKTLIFLKEQNIDSYDDLCKRVFLLFLRR